MAIKKLNIMTLEFDFPERKNKMTAKAALCQALLDGKTLTVMNCFTEIGFTNIAREITRMVEQPFGVIVSRVRQEGHSRYGQPVSYMEYRLNPQIEGNKEAVLKMREYIATCK